MQNLNLRLLESKTWRTNQQDGLFDLFIGVLFLGIAFAQVADGLWDSEAASLGVLVCVQFGGAAGLWLARRRLTRHGSASSDSLCHAGAACGRRVLSSLSASR